jgi:hypothetical protein
MEIHEQGVRFVRGELHLWQFGHPAAEQLFQFPGRALNEAGLAAR